MPTPLPLPIFDGHNDVLLRLVRKGVADVERHFLDGDGEGHLDLPRMTAGGFGGGLFAVFVPSPSDDPAEVDRKAKRREAMSGASYALPLPAPLLILSATMTFSEVILPPRRRHHHCHNHCRHNNHPHDHDDHHSHRHGRYKHQHSVTASSDPTTTVAAQWDRRTNILGHSSCGVVGAD